MAEHMLQIKASAGSGKTYTLTRRYLQRLSRCNPVAGEAGVACLLRHDGPLHWGEILAITFTNAAATEMRERVIRALKEAALGHPLEGIPLTREAAIRWLDIILRDMDALNIRTIDSLLHRIVRAAALQLNLPPDFQPVFATGEAMQPYVDALLDEAWRGNEAMRHLLRQVYTGYVVQGGSRGFLAGTRLVDGLGRVWDGFLDKSYDAVADAKVVTAHRDALWEELQEAVRAFRQSVQVCGALVNKNADNACTKLLSGDGSGCGSRLFDGEPRKLVTAKSVFPADLEQTASVLVDTVRRLRWPLSVLDLAVRDVATVHLARVICEAFRENASREGNIPAVLVPSLARSALEGEYGVPETLCRMGNRLRHFMLDEFQDTSRLQWAAMRPLVLEALSQGGTLTWVGDVKQAIYGWRGGDAALFDEIADDAGLAGVAQGCLRESLPCNWRSQRVIVEHNNALFAPLACRDMAEAVLDAILKRDKVPPHIFAQAVDAVMAAYAETTQQCPDNAADGGYVDVRSVTEDELEAALLPLVRDELGTRRPWSDILVLVRTNRMARCLAEQLMGRNIPVITENSLLLAEHPLVMQLVALLRFLDRPEDDVALWAVLSGSLLGGHERFTLTPQELYDWRVSSAPRRYCPAPEDRLPLWQRFAAFQPAIWQYFLQPFLSRSGLMTPYDTVMEWLARVQALERFPDAEIFLRCFMEVLSSSEENGLCSLSSFLFHWDKKGHEEKVPMPENLDAVRVMTIHKSKGLQAPVVIVAGTCFEITAGGMQLMEADGLRVVCRTTAALVEPYQRERARQAVENLNQAYVAFTRACEELYIFRSDKNMAKSPLTRGLDILWESLSLSVPYQCGSLPPVKGCPAAESRSDVTAAEPRNLPPDTQYESFPSGSPDALAEPLSGLLGTEGADGENALWWPMQWLPGLKIFRNPLQSAFRPQDRGELLHLCLERLSALDSHAGLTADELAGMALRYGIHDFPRRVPRDEALFHELERALQWVAGQPRLLAWLRAGSGEHALLLPTRKETRGLRSGRADLIVLGRQRHLVVDYKSGQPDAAHVVQVRGYLACLPDDKPASGLLVYLDSQKFQYVDNLYVSKLHVSLEEVFPQCDEV